MLLCRRRLRRRRRCRFFFSFFLFSSSKEFIETRRCDGVTVRPGATVGRRAAGAFGHGGGVEALGHHLRRDVAGRCRGVEPCVQRSEPGVQSRVVGFDDCGFFEINLIYT